MGDGDGADVSASVDGVGVGIDGVGAGVNVSIGDGVDCRGVNACARADVGIFIASYFQIRCLSSGF